MTSSRKSAGPTAACRDVKDLYTAPARRMISRLAREFLDELLLTPIELLHHAASQKQYLDRRSKYQAAVEKAAMLQAPTAGENVGLRIRELYGLVDHVVHETATRLNGRPPARIDPATFGQFVAALRRSKISDIPDFYVNAALASHLSVARSWTDKMTRLHALNLGAGGDPSVVALLDAVVAEVVDNKAALREFIGASPSRGRFLETVVDLLLAPRAPVTTFDDGAWKLREMLATQPLPETRKSLIRQLHRGLKAKAPLDPAASPADLSAHLRLLAAASCDLEACGDHETRQLLGERLRRLLTIAAVTDVLRPLSSAAERLLRALEIHRQLENAPGRLQLMQYVDFVLSAERTRLTIGQDSDTVTAKLQRITRLHQALVASGEAGLGTHAAWLETLQADLIREDGLFERIAKAHPTPAACALALLDLCMADAFTSGKNLRAAQQQVRRHMSDERFAATLLRGAADRATQVQRLADLQEKLRRCGFANAGGV